MLWARAQEVLKIDELAVALPLALRTVLNDAAKLLADVPVVRPAIPPGQAPSIPSPAAPITGTSVVVGPSSVPGQPGTSTKPVASPNGITIFEGNWEGSDEAEARAIYANDPDKLARNRRLVGELKALYRKSQVVGDVWPAGIPVDRLADVLEVHHIVPLAEGGPDERCNMVVLSPTLHALVHADPTCVIDLQKRTLRIFGCDLQLEVHVQHWLLIGMLSPNQVRAQIAAIRKWTADSPVLGLQSPTRWQGPSEMEVDGVRYLLRAAETELEMRAVLAEPRPENTHVVIITGLDAGKVGEDLLAQFARRRFYSLSATEILRELFQAHEIDPRLQQLKWLATSLADVRPESGYPPAPQGGLDQETAWGCYLDRILNLRPARPDLVAVLTWARDPTNAVRWREQDNDAKPVAARWLEPSVGAALECVLAAQAISSNETVTSPGLVAGVLFDRTDVPIDVATARGKFERYFGDRHIDAAQGKALAVATRQWIDLPDVQTSLARADMERADALLRELRIEGRAIESDVSLIGFEQRLAAYGRALRAFLHKPTADAAETLAQLNRNIASHRSPRSHRIGWSGPPWRSACADGCCPQQHRRRPAISGALRPIT